MSKQLLNLTNPTHVLESEGYLQMRSFVLPVVFCQLITVISCFSPVHLVFCLLKTQFSVTPSLATNPTMPFNPYQAMGLVPELPPLLVPGSPTGLPNMGNITYAQKRADKLEVQCYQLSFLSKSNER